MEVLIYLILGKYFKILPEKTEIYPKVLGRNFNFIFNFSFYSDLRLKKNSDKSQWKKPTGGQFLKKSVAFNDSELL